MSQSRTHEKAPECSVVALAGTGFIWVRYSLVITPVNYSLAAVGSEVIRIFISSELVFRLTFSWVRAALPSYIGSGSEYLIIHSI